MAQDNYAPLLGRLVALDGTSGPFRSCPYCAFNQGRIREGKGPHLGQVVCDNCGRHTAWIGRGHMDAMLAGMTSVGPIRPASCDLIDNEDAA